MKAGNNHSWVDALDLICNEGTPLVKKIFINQLKVAFDTYNSMGDKE